MSHNRAVAQGHRTISGGNPGAWVFPVLGLLLGCGSLIGQVLPPQAEPPGVSIDGTVVDSVTGQPVAGAEVTVHPVRVYAQNYPRPVTLVTGPAGTFRVTDALPGRYRASATHRDYPNEFRHGPPGEEFEAGSTQAATSVRLTLTPGGTVRGRVVDDLGDPLRGCHIAVVKQGHGGKIRHVAGSRLGEDGYYEVKPVPPGRRYYVWANCHDSLPVARPFGPPGPPEDRFPPVSARFPHSFYPGTSELEQAVAVEIGPGTRVEGINFHLEPVRAYRVSGAVRTADGQPLPRSIGVSLVPVSLSPHPPFSGPINPLTGAFVAGHIPPGDYWVEAGSYQPPMYSGQTRVAVTGSPVTGVEVVVVPPIRLEGVLEIETHDDKPYPRAAHGPLAALNLMSSGSQRPMPGSQAKFDEDNRFFAFEGAPPGLWDLVVSPIGTGCVKSIQFRGRDVPLTGRLDLTAGGGDLKVVLTTRCASIKGQIEGAASGNVQPAVLMVFDGGDTRLRSNLTGGLPDAFHITGLSSGTYRIYALAKQNPEIAENPELLRRLNEHSTRVTLSEGEQARVTLRLIPEDVIERAFEGP